MSTKDQVIATAVANQDVPFAVAMAGNASGIIYSGAVGEAAPGRKAAQDTVFRIFSMTKAVGTTAAMILVDRGKLDVETPVEELLPEFAKIQVIDGFDGDKPVMRAPRRKATVRHLATHTSGLAYEFWNADVGKYMAATGHPSILAGTKAAMFYPMVCDPGTRWEYGIGIDWLGQIVEKIDGRRIDRFLQDEIFGPLGMTDTACEVLDHMKDRLAAVSIRGEDGQFGPFEIAPPAQPEVYGMGHTLYSTAPDYMKFLRLFLNKGALNGNRVLSEKGVERMLADHMNGLTFDKMITVAPGITADVDLFPGTRKTHSFGFLRNEADIPGMRSAGSQSWAGVCNTHYWFDPKKDVAAVIMTQSLPFVEPPLMKTYEAYERAVYAG
ncbi:MAG TPA: serine hydrolase domain-containing protein [Vineibacter sp.]|nr:serine hydrolase domain-containing protein [Vineibacter sp.]